ncbi:MAG: DUF1573 domain-containing protein [Bacteroidales bacterium]
MIHNVKKILLGTAFLLVFSALSYTQQQGPVIEFEKLTHNLGKIQEEAGEVSYKYEFVNKGGEPLVINDVKASCGCTTPSWSEKPVMPGEKGYVEVVFDPANRPGNFNKSIVVLTNAEKSNTLLRIRGEVSPRKKGVEDKYPRKMNGLRLKSDHLPFRDVKHTSAKTDSIPIINVSDGPVKVSFNRVPDYLELKTVPDKLQPGQKGMIEGKLDATKVDDWGFFVNRVKLSINNSENRNHQLAYSAKIVEDFSNLTPEERENAPKVEFEQRTYDFGTAKQNTEIQHTFRFTNKGKSDLVVRKIRASCGCTTAKPDKSVIPAGESSSFKVTFRTGRRQGPQRLSIYFISNDPDNSTVRLTLEGTVKK